MKITPLHSLPPPLQLGITVTASLGISATHCRQSTNFSNSLRILSEAWRELKVLEVLLSGSWLASSLVLTNLWTGNMECEMRGDVMKVGRF
jgi:hypothetical protein